MAGPLPCGLFGAEVSGAPPAGILSFDPKCAKASRLIGAGASAPIGWAIAGGVAATPRAIAEVAPLVRYAREWWLARSPDSFERRAAISIKD